MCCQILLQGQTCSLSCQQPPQLQGAALEPRVVLCTTHCGALQPQLPGGWPILGFLWPAWQIHFSLCLLLVLLSLFHRCGSRINFSHAKLSLNICFQRTLPGAIRLKFKAEHWFFFLGCVSQPPIYGKKPSPLGPVLIARWFQGENIFFFLNEKYSEWYSRTLSFYSFTWLHWPQRGLRSEIWLFFMKLLW